MEELRFDFPEAPEPVTRSRLQRLDLLLLQIEGRINAGLASGEDIARRERLVHRREALIEEGKC